ncbi:hypothetical protein SDC9_193697 [bioreactor metagenome]|uniref:Uncharacterized protein n=1 Tax=bioreactor metagenome TaxID=1076179 RepID=A0A645ICU4_9ZZZZ
MEKNVFPYAPGAWIDETVTDKGPFADGKVGVVGTEISFNKWFYKYQELPASKDIAKEIIDEQDGLEDMLKEIFQ